MARNNDPGEPSESSIRSFDFLLNQADAPEANIPPAKEEPAPAPTTKVEPDRPAPEPVSSDEGLNFRKVNDPVPTAFRKMDDMLHRDADKTLQLIFEGVDLEFEYYEEHSSTISASDGSSMTLRRFLLPSSTKVNIKPTQSLKIALEDGVERPVSFLGDMHNLDGLLPFKMITFLEPNAAP